MHSKRSRLIMLLGVAALVLGGSAVAQAGFISAGVDDSSWLTGSLSTGSLSTGAAGQESPGSTFPEVRPGDYPYHVAFLGPTGSGGSMNSQSVTGSSVSGPLAVVAGEQEIQAELISRLDPEDRVWLPPAFMSGVFRPPRCIG